MEQTLKSFELRLMWLENEEALLMELKKMAEIGGKHKLIFSLIILSSVRFTDGINKSRCG